MHHINLIHPTSIPPPSESHPRTHVPRTPAARLEAILLGGATMKAPTSPAPKRTRQQSCCSSRSCRPWLAILPGIEALIEIRTPRQAAASTTTIAWALSIEVEEIRRAKKGARTSDSIQGRELILISVSSSHGTPRACWGGVVEIKCKKGVTVEGKMLRAEGIGHGMIARRPAGPGARSFSARVPNGDHRLGTVVYRSIGLLGPVCVCLAGDVE